MLNRIGNLSVDSRLDFFRKATFIFFIGGILLSFSLWNDDRWFPTLPLIGEKSFLRSPLDFILLSCLLGFLVAGIFRWSAMIGWSILALTAITILDDQNRLQAWVYICVLFILAFTIASETEKATQYLRVIVIGMYIWTGIHKLNPEFIEATFTDILESLFGMTDQRMIDHIAPIGYLIPLIEISIGIMLIFPKYRNQAFWLVLITHLLILAYLSPLGVNANSVVYPWNAAMMVGAFLLFFNREGKLMEWGTFKRDFRLIAVVLIAWVMPLLNFFGYCDHYLSFSYYSGKSSNFFVALSDDAVKQVDESAHAYFVTPANATGGVFLDVNSWSIGELNVPFVPEERAFRKMRIWFCNRGIAADQIYFFEVKQGVEEELEYIRTSCGDD